MQTRPVSTSHEEVVETISLCCVAIVNGQRRILVHSGASRNPSSVLAKEEPLPAWVVYFELAFTSKEFMRQVAPIEPQWLIEIAPHFYQESDVQDSQTKKMPKNK